jgi:hypothetical protein
LTFVVRDVATDPAARDVDLASTAHVHRGDNVNVARGLHALLRARATVAMPPPQHDL